MAARYFGPDAVDIRNGVRFACLTAAAIFTLGNLSISSARGDDGDCRHLPSVYVAHGDTDARIGPGENGRLHILTIGSSSTAGVGASTPAHSYPAQLDRKLEDIFGQAIDVENAGVSGETADQTVARLEQRLERARYNLVIWQVGTNDALRGGDPAAFVRLLNRGIAAAKRAKAKLVLLDPQYFPGIKNLPLYERYVATVESIGSENGVPVFSRYALMKAWANGDITPGAKVISRPAATPALDQSKPATPLLATMLSADAFHMSDRGYACVARLLAEDITGSHPPTAVLPVTRLPTGFGAPAGGAAVISAAAPRPLSAR